MVRIVAPARAAADAGARATGPPTLPTSVRTGAELGELFNVMVALALAPTKAAHAKAATNVRVLMGFISVGVGFLLGSTALTDGCPSDRQTLVTSEGQPLTRSGVDRGLGPGTLILRTTLSGSTT